MQISIMSNIFNVLAPKERKFFPMFESASENLVVSSNILSELVSTNDPIKRKELINLIEDHEHRGDSITHEIMDHLSRTFITPFDREDIHSLTTAMDDIIDFVHGACKRIELYKVDKLTSETVKLAELIQEGCKELDIAIHNLRNLKDRTKIHEACVRINSIENHADDVFNFAIAKLFEEEKDPVYIIKYKEILSALEIATDKCEDAADVIKAILIKNS
jgi:hypothetical protein